MTDKTAYYQKDLAEKLNSTRLTRVLNVLPDLQQHLFHIIPFLIHYNQIDVPGIIDPRTPSGIYGFSLSKAMHSACEALSLSMPDTVHSTADAFEGVYAMGSTASFGQNPQSDVDIWLVYNSKLTQKQLKLIEYKNKLISDWFAGFDFEVNFYLVHPMQFRECSAFDNCQPVGLEHSGSSQHWLLLEEFYRSHIRLAGKVVAWWPDANSQNTEFDASLLYLGDINSLPAAEYFGASLWQLYKGLNKPHKALLKVLLLETYASEYPSTTLITQQIWQYCEHQDFSVDNDAYLLLYQRIEAYLIAQGDHNRLEIVRRCFYLKSGVTLSCLSPNSATDWRVDKIQNLVKQWAWSRELVATLDNSPYWHAGQLKWFNQQLSELLLVSYKNLLKFASKQTLSERMRVEELGLLARKLHTYFSNDDHLLQPLNRLWSLSTAEKSLTIRHSEQTSRFYLYRQAYDELDQFKTDTRHQQNAFDNHAIHDADNVCSLVAWSVMNGLATAETHWSQVGDCNKRSDKLGYLARKLIPIMHHVPTVSKRDLCEPWCYQKIVLIANMDGDPTTQWHGPESMLDYAHASVLSLGQTKLNMLSSVAIVCLNSWGEWQSHRFNGHTALLEAISFIILGLKRSNEQVDLSIISCSAKLKQQIFNQLKTLLLRCYGLMKKVNQTNTLMHPITIGDQQYTMYFNALGMMYRISDLATHKKNDKTHGLPLPDIADDPNLSTPSVIHKFIVLGAKQYFLRERNQILDVFIADELNQLEHLQYQHTSINDFVAQESHLYVFDEQKQRQPVFNMPQFFQLVRMEGGLTVMPFGLTQDEMGSAF
ncbi:class I adenylate cyclase [Shewanella livingstonensis]|uniref:Adenylate cyclase n=1 Tax=Shewanella livingstonensis TaxID=150120 RepID=A0A3G8LRV5_9GAMM|nr:class I adenylate cyclase [Shewanella livingstonensis]AZG71945.1 class I adenylate cyclase [Shewanella livingstonensis]